MSMDASEYLHNIYVKSQQVSPVRIRKFNRKRLLEFFAELGYTTGAEVGVAEGWFSEGMLKIIPNLKLYSIDPWSPVKENLRSKRVGKDLAQSRYENAKNRLGKYPGCVMVKNISTEAARDIEFYSLDFVYIDGAHTFDYVMEDIITWARRVRKGGIVSGHDYYRFRDAGVVQAVDLYTHMHSITEYFLTDDRTPSWFWVKER